MYSSQVILYSTFMAMAFCKKSQAPDEELLSYLMGEELPSSVSRDIIDFEMFSKMFSSIPSLSLSLTLPGYAGALYALTGAVVIGFLGYLVNAALTRQWMSTWQDLNIPSPPCSTVLGNSLQIRKQGGMRACVRRWYEQYGKVFGFYMHTQPVLVVAESQIAEEILNNSEGVFHDRYGVPEKLRRELEDKCLFFSHGSQWDGLHYIICTAFSPDNLTYMTHRINRCANNLAEYTEDMANDESNNQMSKQIKELMTAYSLDTMAAMLLGQELDHYSNDDNSFFQAVTSTLSCSETEFSGVSVPSRMRHLKKFFTQNISDRSGPERREGMVDFLDIFLHSGTPSESITNSGLMFPTYAMTQEEIVATLCHWVLHSHDTLISALQFVMHVLASFPDHQQIVFSEIESNIVSDEPTYTELNSLPFLDLVIKEVLRLFSPVQEIWRYASQETVVDNITIPAHAAILIPVNIIHADKDYFTEPELFEPERYIQDVETSFSATDAFLSFGSGPRTCPGFEMVLMLLKAAVVHIIRKVKLERPPEKESVPKAEGEEGEVQTGLDVTDEGVLRPTSSARLKMEPRRPQDVFKLQPDENATVHALHKCESLEKEKEMLKEKDKGSRVRFFRPADPEDEEEMELMADRSRSANTVASSSPPTSQDSPHDVHASDSNSKYTHWLHDADYRPPGPSSGTTDTSPDSASSPSSRGAADTTTPTTTTATTTPTSEDVEDFDLMSLEALLNKEQEEKAKHPLVESDHFYDAVEEHGHLVVPYALPGEQAEMQTGNNFGVSQQHPTPAPTPDMTPSQDGAGSGGHGAPHHAQVLFKTHSVGSLGASAGKEQRGGGGADDRPGDDTQPRTDTEDEAMQKMVSTLEEMRHKKKKKEKKEKKKKEKERHAAGREDGVEEDGDGRTAGARTDDVGSKEQRGDDQKQDVDYNRGMTDGMGPTSPVPPEDKTAPHLQAERAELGPDEPVLSDTQLHGHRKKKKKKKDREETGAESPPSPTNTDRTDEEERTEKKKKKKKDRDREEKNAQPTHSPDHTDRADEEERTEKKKKKKKDREGKTTGSAQSLQNTDGTDEEERTEKKKKKKKDRDREEEKNIDSPHLPDHADGRERGEHTEKKTNKKKDKAEKISAESLHSSPNTDGTEEDEARAEKKKKKKKKKKKDLGDEEAESTHKHTVMAGEDEAGGRLPAREEEEQMAPSRDLQFLKGTAVGGDSGDSKRKGGEQHDEGPSPSHETHNRQAPSSDRDGHHGKKKKKKSKTWNDVSVDHQLPAEGHEEKKKKKKKKHSVQS